MFNAYVDFSNINKLFDEFQRIPKFPKNSNSKFNYLVFHKAYLNQKILKKKLHIQLIRCIKTLFSKQAVKVYFGISIIFHTILSYYH